MAKQTAPTASEGLVQLDPSLIQAEDNSRYSTKDVDGMMASIKQSGGVMVPVEVEPLIPPANGFKYKLTYGFLRHAAVERLNKEEGAGLTIPATVHANATPVERLRRQISENLERQSLSVMDQAVAIKKLLDNGVPKVEVREIFATKAGRKGNKTQPASNSFINMMLAMLELPKKYQQKIDSGLLTTTGAWELYKAPEEKRDGIFEAAEADRNKQLEREEKDEKRFLETERKATEAQAKQTEAEKAMAAAQEKAKAAKELLAAKAAAATEAYNAQQGAEAKDRKALKSNFDAAEKIRAESQRESEKADNELSFLVDKRKKAEEATQVAAARLKEARNATAQGAQKKGAGVSGKDVQKAAAAQGEAEHVALSAKECREAVHYLTLPGGNPKTAAIGKVLTRCFAGELTDKQLAKEIDKIVS